MKRFDTIHLDNRYINAVPPIEDSINSAIFPYLLSYISIELLLCAVITVIAIVAIESKRYDLPPPNYFFYLLFCICCNKQIAKEVEHIACRYTHNLGRKIEIDL